MTGMMDYGTVSFSGLFDVSNALTGQSALISALANNSKIQNIRLYIDAVSYYAPNVTVASGGLVAAGMYVTSCTIGADKSGLATIEFTGKFTGPVCII
jgi:hypothetical protein